MKNLFSLTINTVMKEIHDISIDGKNIPRSKIETLWNRFVRNSILCITDEDEEKLQQANSIEEIAIICIDIAKPLFLYPDSAIDTKFVWHANNYDLFAQAINEKMKNPDYDMKQGKYLIEKWDYCDRDATIEKHKNSQLSGEGRHFEDIRFFDEVKKFLVRSFIYHQSCNKTFAKFSLQDVIKVFPNSFAYNEGKKIYSNRLSILNSKQEKFRSYVLDSSGKTSYTPNRYLDFLIEYYEKQGIRRKNNYRLSSWYDALIFEGLVKSSSPSENPYLSADGMERKRNMKCNLDSFLSGFYPQSINPKYSSFHEINADIQKLIMNNFDFNRNESTKKIFFANLFFWHDITTYLIERLTNINLVYCIEQLYSAYEQFSQIKCLYHLSAYPLISYRLELIDRFRLFFSNCKKDSWEKTMASCNDRMIKIIQQHLFIAFPYTEMLFNLSLLRNNFYFHPVEINQCESILKEEPLFSFKPPKMGRRVAADREQLQKILARSYNPKASDIESSDQEANRTTDEYSWKTSDSKALDKKCSIFPFYTKPTTIKNEDEIIKETFRCFGNYAIWGDRIENTFRNIICKNDLINIRYLNSGLWNYLIFSKIGNWESEIDKERNSIPLPFMIRKPLH